MKKLLVILLFITLTAATQPPQPRLEIYTIQGDDTLSQIADKVYADAYVWPAIWRATNAQAAASPAGRFQPIRNPNQLRPGQQILLPPRAELNQWLNPAPTDEPRPQPLDDQLLTEFVAYVAEARERFEIPGVAVVVVEGDMVRLAEGFGIRELGQPESVTPETVFAVGSTTKPVNAMLVATLVDDGVLTWDQPVTEIWPGFVLADPETTAQISVRDLLSMRTGMGRADLLWSGAELTPEALLESLAEVEPLIEPGQLFFYNNQSASAAGYLSALAAGSEYGKLQAHYHALMRERIFAPVGMASATLSVEQAQAQPNHATPHDLNLAGEIVPTYYHEDASISPAGGLNANAIDMGRFLMTQIRGGLAPDGTRVVSTRNLTETWQPHIGVAVDRVTYGMGWFLERYRGIPIRWHDGDVFGFKAIIAVFPEADVGLVVLSNRILARWFASSVQYRFAEALYGFDDFYADNFYETQRIAFENALREANAKLSPIEPESMRAYAGQYEGNWRVELRADGTLWAIRGQYGWQIFLANDGTPGSEDYLMVYNGYGLGITIDFVEDNISGTTSLEFRLSTGEEGKYQKID